MKTGWIISVRDKQSNDTSFKCFMQPRKAVADKAADIFEKHKELFDKDQFSVYLSGHHSEINPENRMLVKHAVTEEQHPAKLTFAELHDLSPMCIRKENGEAIFEVDQCEELPPQYSRISG